MDLFLPADCNEAAIEFNRFSKLDFTSTTVTIILLRSDAPVPQHVDRFLEPINGSNPVSIFGESSSTRPNGVRQSKRIKNGLNMRRHAVKIFKDWTIKDLKVAVRVLSHLPFNDTQPLTHASCGSDP